MISYATGGRYTAEDAANVAVAAGGSVQASQIALGLLLSLRDIMSCTAFTSSMIMVLYLSQTVQYCQTTYLIVVLSYLYTDISWCITTQVHAIFMCFKSDAWTPCLGQNPPIAWTP